MSEETLRRTPLYETHRALNARIVPFAGWEMPVQYAGILDEARSVRSGAGLFDISHMGRAYLSGEGAQALLQRLTTNDVSALADGQAHYSLLTNPQGGIIDDIIVYRLGKGEYLAVLNAGNTAKDLDWIRQAAKNDVRIDDRTAETAMIAAQGPQAREIVAKLADQDVLSIPRFGVAKAQIQGVPATVCRTGYTGEDGFELICSSDSSASLWRALQESGGAPCGLGARDALRIEAGYPLYGHEIDETTSPVEAALMWAVQMEKGDFVGREEIARIRAQGARRKLVGLTLQERIAPRQGYTLYVGEEAVGVVTSGIFSPTLGHSIGMAYIDSPYHRPGTEVQVEVRAQRYPAVVTPKKNLLPAKV